MERTSLLSFACALALITIAPAQAPASEIVLHNFACPPRGANPQAGVIRDPAGNLYGTTSGGGTANAGVDGGRWGQPLFRDPSAAEHVMAGTDADEDLRLLISNTDDHLRNYGFLYAGPAGWRLAPAYDLNPVPTDIKPRILSTAINEDDNTASLAMAVEVAGYFELDDGKARDIAKQVGKAVSKWRDEAARHGMNKAEMDRMSSAFDHNDLKAALAAR